MLVWFHVDLIQSGAVMNAINFNTTIHLLRSRPPVWTAAVRYVMTTIKCWSSWTIPNMNKTCMMKFRDTADEKLCAFNQTVASEQLTLLIWCILCCCFFYVLDIFHHVLRQWVWLLFVCTLLLVQNFNCISVELPDFTGPIFKADENFHLVQFWLS